MPELTIGSVAPDFEGIDQNGKKVLLSDSRGKTVVLYFYPKDDTPGCTAEACSFRDNAGILQEAGIKVLGVSADNVQSHKKFVKKYNLNFTLVSDSEGRIMRNYGVKGPFGVARRVTYLIDREGVIRYVWKKVHPAGHSVEILQKVREFGL